MHFSAISFLNNKLIRIQGSYFRINLLVLGFIMLGSKSM